MIEPRYAVVDDETEQWVTGPMPYSDAADLVRVSGPTRVLHLEEVKQ